ncbi:MAG: M15 family metallopeptidase [Elusimicrobia bacterium]|nr:M15 family metallopeptidase [Elusimicrobiota bacterium]
MRRLLLPALASLLGACALLGARADEPMVDVTRLDPRIRVDIRYATPSNFTKTVLYPQARCMLRSRVAKRLSLAQADLSAVGLGLKVWDCYRPLSIQKKLWELVPDTRYVANPAKGSRHNRGAAVDVTLVDLNGTELPMPTEYDDFSERAHRDWAGASPAALRNRQTLEAVMQRHGFTGLSTEWWHFDARGWDRYPLSDVPLSP